MSFLSREWRVAFNGCVKVSSAHVLDESGHLNVCWGNVWQLDPVFEEVVVDPVDQLVDSFTSLFNFP